MATTKIDKTGDAAIMPLHRILMKMCGRTGYTPDAVFEGLLDYIIGYLNPSLYQWETLVQKYAKDLGGTAAKAAAKPESADNDRAGESLNAFIDSING